MSGNPTSEQFGNYQLACNYFNEALFDGKLPPCLLNFSRKAKTRGFFAFNRWEQGDLRTHEISLNPDVLARPPIEIMSTLVHEMVHLWQYTYGKPSGSYHNQEWDKKMESLGLMPSTTGEVGGKKTGHKVTHYVMEGGEFKNAFEKMPKEYYLPWQSSGESKQMGSRQDKVKYSCPTCKTNIWGKAGLELICKSCAQDFVQRQEVVSASAVTR